MIFKIDKWTRIDNTLEQRNNILVSVFALFGLFTATVQLLNDLYHKSYYSTQMDGLIILVLLSVYFLNERGKHKLAKIIFLSFINFLLFVYACIVPKEVGVFLFFFPMISIATLIFNSNESKIRNPLVILPFIFIVILEFSDYQFFGNINIQQGNASSETSFLINLFISIIILIFSLLYLVKINRNFETKKDEIAQELLEANEFLKKTNDELDHFVYSASHDLKAPLSSILGLINIAKLEVKEDKSLEYFDLINDRVDKLNSFIKDIINLSRNSRLQIEPEEVSLPSIVENVIENNRYMSNTDSIKFKTDVIDDKIKIDKSRLEIILNNLISNAIKYHKTEGDRYVTITIKQSQDHLIIKVKDNGIGIHNDHQDKVFNMFYRGHENSEGSGLGLYIVSEVTNKMDGEISLSSEEGMGTEINIKIPL